MDKETKAVITLLAIDKLKIDSKKFGPVAATIFINDFLPLLEKYNWNIKEVEEYRKDFLPSLREIALLKFFDLASTKQCREIINYIWLNPHVSVINSLVTKKFLEETKEDELTILIDKLIIENPKVVEQIKQGKNKAIGFLMGQIMKETKGKIDPKSAQKIINEKIAP